MNPTSLSNLGDLKPGLKPGTNVCAKKKIRNEMPGHEDRRTCKRRGEQVCGKGKDENGTKWKGREPMKPNLVENLLQRLFCV